MQQGIGGEQLLPGRSKRLRLGGCGFARPAQQVDHLVMGLELGGEGLRIAGPVGLGLEQGQEREVGIGMLPRRGGREQQHMRGGLAEDGDALVEQPAGLHAVAFIDDDHIP